MIRSEYLRSRGWFKFAGLETWNSPCRKHNDHSEEEAECIQLDRDEAALRHLLNKRPDLLWSIRGKR